MPLPTTADLTAVYAPELAFLDEYCRGVDGHISRDRIGRFFLVADVSHDESYGEAVQLRAHNSFDGTLTDDREGEYWTVGLFGSAGEIIAIGANSSFEEAYENAVAAVAR